MCLGICTNRGQGGLPGHGNAQPRAYQLKRANEGTGEAQIRRPAADLCSILSVENRAGDFRAIICQKTYSPGHRASARKSAKSRALSWITRVVACSRG